MPLSGTRGFGAHKVGRGGLPSLRHFCLSGQAEMPLPAFGPVLCGCSACMWLPSGCIRLWFLGCLAPGFRYGTFWPIQVTCAAAPGRAVLCGCATLLCQSLVSSLPMHIACYVHPGRLGLCGWGHGRQVLWGRHPWSHPLTTAWLPRSSFSPTH